MYEGWLRAREPTQNPSFNQGDGLVNEEQPRLNSSVENQTLNLKSSLKAGEACSHESGLDRKAKGCQSIGQSNDSKSRHISQELGDKIEVIPNARMGLLYLSLGF
ncbi:hypothetical protein ACFE04_000240 [Oxalis oulophora]